MHAHTVYPMLSRRSKIAKYRSRVRTTTIFHWPPVPIFKFFFFWGGKGSNFKCHLSNSQKALPWPERRLMTYCAWGVSSDATCGHGEETQKRTETFMRQTGYFLQTTHVDVAPWNFAWAWGVMSRKYCSYIFQVSWKSAEGSRSCRWSKIAHSQEHLLCYWSCHKNFPTEHDGSTSAVLHLK